MGHGKRKERVSVEEYFAMSERSEEKLEYHDGEIFAMAGGSIPHSIISVNLTSSLQRALLDKDCLVLNSDVRLNIESDNSYVYPDAAVVCGPVEYEKERKDTLRNPLLVIEVLSESTEAYDRGEKFRKYRSVPSIQEYVLVDPTKPSVEKFYRGEEGAWVMGSQYDMSGEIHLESLNISLPLADVYRKIEW